MIPPFSFASAPGPSEEAQVGPVAMRTNAGSAQVVDMPRPEVAAVGSSLNVRSKGECGRAVPVRPPGRRGDGSNGTAEKTEPHPANGGSHWWSGGSHMTTSGKPDGSASSASATACAQPTSYEEIDVLLGLVEPARREPFAWIRKASW